MSDPEKPATLPQSVTLDAFLRHQFGKLHLDQGGGFAYWCGKNGHTRHTTLEWRNLLQEFSNKPVG